MTKAQAYRLGLFHCRLSGLRPAVRPGAYLADLKAEYEAIRLR